MAITRTRFTAAATGSSAVNTVSATWSGATAAGAFLLAFYTHQGVVAAGTYAIASAAGSWTAGPGAQNNGNAQVYSWYQANASTQGSGTSVTVTVPSSGTKNQVLIIVEYAGVDPTTPFNALEVSAAQAVTTTPAASGSTPVLAAGAYFAAGMLAHRNSTGTFTGSPTGMTAVGTETDSGNATSGNNICALWYEASGTADGSTTTAGVSQAMSSGLDNGGIVLAMRPTASSKPIRSLLGVGV